MTGGLTTTFHLSKPLSDLRDAALAAAQRQQQEQEEPRRRHLQMKPQSGQVTSSGGDRRPMVTLQNGTWKLPGAAE